MIIRKQLRILIVLTGLLAACVPTPTPSPTPVTEQPLYVALVWHQHQPLYYKDPELALSGGEGTGVYTRPWARVHATKDYYDMAAMLEGYPDVHVTFNLTPVLIRQLDDLAAGAKDVYWVLAEKPADQLTDDDKRFILRRFFDANWDNVIRRFPRYGELLEERGGTDDEAIERALQTFTEGDFRAEGSDWFWWYGADQDSGVDEYFDFGFRALQKEVYRALGEPVPDYLDVPIIPARAAAPTRGATGAIAPTIDGIVSPGEWDAAGYYEARGGAQARAAESPFRGENVAAGLYYGYDAKNLYPGLRTPGVRSGKLHRRSGREERRLPLQVVRTCQQPLGVGYQSVGADLRRVH